MNNTIKSFVTGVVIASALLFSGVALAAGSFLAPSRGAYLSPGYFALAGYNLIGTLANYALGTTTQPFQGVWSTYFVATATTSTSTFAGSLAIGTTTTPYQFQVINPRTSSTTLATTTASFGDMTATTSRASFNMMSDTGSTTCLYIHGTSSPTVVVEPGVCK